MATTDKQLYVISDLHLGGLYPNADIPDDRGFRLCTHVKALTDFIETLAGKPAQDPQIELVINGDTVDFLAEKDKDSLSWTSFVADPEAAVEKLERIAEHDPDFFKALGHFLKQGHRLVILLGNHDIELSLPRVRKKFSALIGVKGDHDFDLIYDGEGYRVGSIPIEHGNRYDRFNIVDYNGLRQLRSLQSRQQAVPAKYRFDPPAGSEMVANVINPIKEKYPFIDKLKPETEAVIPLLLALEPGYRKILLKAAQLALKANKHKLESAALPGFGGDIHADSDAASRPFGGDMGSMTSMVEATPEKSGDDDLEALLEPVLGDQASVFIEGINEAESASELDATLKIGGDISTKETIQTAAGFTQLLLSKNDDKLQKRLPYVYMAMRSIQTEAMFSTDTETASEYIEAAESLAENGFKYIVFGHTHHPKKIPLRQGGFYLNSGTWADMLHFPQKILAGSKEEALEKLGEFANLLTTGDFSSWSMFRPTYVRFDLGPAEEVLAAELCHYSSPEEL